MSTICICGAGTMGSGIAQVSAAAGFQTILFDLQQEVLQKAKEKIYSDLQKLTDKKKITEEKRQETIRQLYFTSDIHQCIADVVIEAIVEKLDVKVELFKQLAEFNSMETIFASNTSSLSITAIAEEILSSKRVAGLHFFNPAPVMKLVEIVRAEQTSDEVIDMLIDLTRRFGKEPVVCKDAPGFIVNRVARPYYIESLRLAEEGVADFETIDRLLENSGFKMGPFKLMDLIGNDVNYAVSCSVYEQMQKPERLKPSYIQKEKVEQGALGKKTGSGYYNYE
ncbi:MAG: 3-hydroxybutyryl-CoA dehydrogenase [Flavisolibacter sp.]|jgi:3-hydroxybutyryl-CoA dehydrogenase|nr:3-hydroxybutyryl-CoA dehydrogenase [Flavisolibacter sp.]